MVAATLFFAGTIMLFFAKKNYERKEDVKEIKLDP